jgi:hypothetical protein
LFSLCFLHSCRVLIETDSSASQWLEALPADSRDAETHRWWWADWDKMLEAWRRDAKLQSYVDSVQALVVAGQQV